MTEGRYLMVRPDEWTLFLTDCGTPFELGQMSGLVRRYMRRAGIREGSCHALRNACATHMLENGADVRFIQAMQGYAELKSTRIYPRVAISKLRQVHAATHPAKMPRDQAAASLLAAIEVEAQAEAEIEADERECNGERHLRMWVEMWHGAGISAPGTA